MSYNSTSSWIKLDRRILKWGWYSDMNVKGVFLHLLLIASYEDGEYLGNKIKRGQAIIGTVETANQLGITRQQLRTALSKLEKSGEISKKTTNKFTLITIENYNKYQDVTLISNQRATNEQPTDNQRATNEQPTDNQRVTNEQPTDNQRVTTLKNVKKLKKVKNNIYIRPHAGEFENVKLTSEELEKLKADYDYCYEEYIEKLSSYLAQTGKRYKSHYATLLNWIRRDGKEKQETKQDNAVKVTVV